MVDRPASERHHGAFDEALPQACEAVLDARGRFGVCVAADQAADELVRDVGGTPAVLGALDRVRQLEEVAGFVIGLSFAGFDPRSAVPGVPAPARRERSTALRPGDREPLTGGPLSPPCSPATPGAAPRTPRCPR